MHDFVSYLFYLLQRGMRFAVPAALICGLILAVCYAVCRRQGRRFPWGKAVCAVLLVGWAAVTVFVTLLRSEPNEFAARQCNLQLFLAWREAYQRFTLQIWLNVLLNIALFVPLGVLLPLLWKPFRKWYAALGAGFGGGSQVDFHRGIGQDDGADVPSVHDDTFFPSHLLLEADHGFAHETECGHDADFGRYGQRTDVVFHQGPVQIGLWLSRLGIALESDVYVRKGGFQAVGVYLIAVE